MADLETVHATIDHTGITGVTGDSLAAAVYRATSASYSTTSSTYTDIDGTNLTLSITTGAHRVKVTLMGMLNIAATNTINIDVLVDGTGLGNNGAFQYRGNSNGYETVTMVYVTDALTAGSHTIKLQWKCNGNTAGLGNSSYLIYMVEELPV